MPDYAAMYRKLFQSMTIAIEVLQEAQRDTEEMYISSEPPDIREMNRDESAREKEKFAQLINLQR